MPVPHSPRIVGRSPRPAEGLHSSQARARTRVSQRRWQPSLRRRVPGETRRLACTQPDESQGRLSGPCLHRKAARIHLETAQCTTGRPRPGSRLGRSSSMAWPATMIDGCIGSRAVSARCWTRRAGWRHSPRQSPDRKPVGRSSTPLRGTAGSSSAESMCLLGQCGASHRKRGAAGRACRIAGFARRGRRGAR